jgi:alcohol dehydrogenase
MQIPESSTPVSIPGSRVKLAFAPGALSHIGQIARNEGASRVLLVTDPGIRDAGHAERAVRSLYNAGLIVRIFDEVEENPTTDVVTRGLRIAREARPDFIIGLGGGSSMDCAKGVNFLLTNGGRMQDYWGVNKAARPMLPLIAVPTTAGTGSEAQSFALITDPETHQKMACGDQKALPRAAVLDPQLTATQPPRVAAATGIDAIAHAVETAVTTKLNATSQAFSAEAWRRLERSFEAAVRNGSATDEIRADMLAGAHLAGCAIENSMLGAAHALANPLTAHFAVPHGFAVGLMLPHVVRFNGVTAERATGGDPYRAVLNIASDELAQRIECLLDAGRIARRLRDHQVPESSLPMLAAEAARQWTAAFNPRPVHEHQMLDLYRSAL